MFESYAVTHMHLSHPLHPFNKIRFGWLSFQFNTTTRTNYMTTWHSPVQIFQQISTKLRKTIKKITSEYAYIYYIGGISTIIHLFIFQSPKNRLAEGVSTFASFFFLSEIFRYPFHQINIVHCSLHIFFCDFAYKFSTTVFAQFFGFHPNITTYPTQYFNKKCSFRRVKDYLNYSQVSINL